MLSAAKVFIQNKHCGPFSQWTSTSVAASDAFLEVKHEIKHSVSEVLRIIIILTELYAFLKKSWYPPTFLSDGYRGLFPGVKQPEPEANHSLPCSAEVKNAWSYTSTYVFVAWCLVLSTGYVFMAWYLFKLRGNFAFALSRN
jgi:hypothetical protein